jgi:peptidoglycan/xylan/chitin deacetylase (PgdA/CDA1 family)
MRSAKQITKRLLAGLTAVDTEGDVALAYHSVGGDSPASIAAPTFSAQVKYLSSTFRFVGASDLGDTAQTEDRRAVSLTFDDGFFDSYETVFPYLGSLGVPFTVFVATGFIDRSCDFRWSPHYSGLSPLSWSHIKEMHRHGVGIGAHTVSHPCLSACSPGVIEAELKGSKDRLEQVLGSRVTTMAYPFGQHHDVSNVVLRIVRDMGYERAFTTVPDVIRPTTTKFLMPRITIASEDEMVDIRQKLAGQRSYMLALGEARSYLARLGVVKTTSSCRGGAR